MSSELQTAKYLRCIWCGDHVYKKDNSESLYRCLLSNGTDHPAFEISSKFDTESGIIEKQETLRKVESDLV